MHCLGGSGLGHAAGPHTLLMPINAYSHMHISWSFSFFVQGLSFGFVLLRVEALTNESKH